MKTLIAVPCMDMMATRFVSSLLSMRVSGQVEFQFACGSLVYDARNQAARKAITDDFDRVLWIDSDMTFDKDMFERMSARLDEGYEYVSGLFFSRKDECQPCIYNFVGLVDTPEGKLPTSTPYEPYPKDSLFEVAGTGLAGVMMTTNLIREAAEEYKLPFSPAMGFGEDLSFCLRVTDMGKKMYCDSSIKFGHVGYKVYGEKEYRDRKGL